MQKVRITFEISKEDLLDALKEVGRGFDLKLRKDINLEELEMDDIVLDVVEVK